MPSCAVPGCYKSQNNQVVSLHVFPRDEKGTLDIWKARIANPKIDYNAKNFICGNHFIKECQSPGTNKLRKYSLPTINCPGFHGEPSVENSFLLPPTLLHPPEVVVYRRKSNSLANRLQYLEQQFQQRRRRHHDPGRSSREHVRPQETSQSLVPVDLPGSSKQDVSMHPEETLVLQPHEPAQQPKPVLQPHEPIHSSELLRSGENLQEKALLRTELPQSEENSPAEPPQSEENSPKQPRDETGPPQSEEPSYPPELPPKTHETTHPSEFLQLVETPPEQPLHPPPQLVEPLLQPHKPTNPLELLHSEVPPLEQPLHQTKSPQSVEPLLQPHDPSEFLQFEEKPLVQLEPSLEQLLHPLPPQSVEHILQPHEPTNPSGLLQSDEPPPEEPLHQIKSPHSVEPILQPHEPTYPSGLLQSDELPPEQPLHQTEPLQPVELTNPSEPFQQREPLIQLQETALKSEDLKLEEPTHPAVLQLQPLVPELTQLSDILPTNSNHPMDQSESKPSCSMLFDIPSVVKIKEDEPEDNKDDIVLIHQDVDENDSSQLAISFVDVAGVVESKDQVARICDSESDPVDDPNNILHNRDGIRKFIGKRGKIQKIKNKLLRNNPLSNKLVQFAIKRFVPRYLLVNKATGFHNRQRLAWRIFCYIKQGISSKRRISSSRCRKKALPKRVIKSKLVKSKTAKLRKEIKARICRNSSVAKRTLGKREKSKITKKIFKNKHKKRKQEEIVSKTRKIKNSSRIKEVSAVEKMIRKSKAKKSKNASAGILKFKPRPEKSTTNESTDGVHTSEVEIKRKIPVKATKKEPKSSAVIKLFDDTYSLEDNTIPIKKLKTDNRVSKESISETVEKSSITPSPTLLNGHLRITGEFVNSKTFKILTTRIGINPLAIKLLTLQMKTKFFCPIRQKFSIEDRIFALSILKKFGLKQYKELGEYCALPPPKCIYDLKDKIPFLAGVQSQVFLNLKKSVAKLEESDKYCSLLFLEIPLAVEEDGAKDEDVVDKVDKLDVDVKEEMVACKDKRNDGDNVIVFMLRGINRDWRQPVLFKVTTGRIKANELAHILDKVIFQVLSTGFRLKAVIFNRKERYADALTLLNAETFLPQIGNSKVSNPLTSSSSFENYSNSQQKKSFNSRNSNPIRNTGHVLNIHNQEIILLYNPSNLLRSIRNGWLNYDISFKVFGKKKQASWNHIIKLFDADDGNEQTKFCPKLTRQHVKPAEIDKGSIRCCTQVFSQRVSSIMSKMALLEACGLDKSALGTADFLLFFDRLYDSVSGTNRTQEQGKPLRNLFSAGSPHREFWCSAQPTLASMAYITSFEGNESNIFKSWLLLLGSLYRLTDRLVNQTGFTNLPLGNLNCDPLESFARDTLHISSINVRPSFEMFLESFKTLVICGDNVNQSMADYQLHQLDSLKDYVYDEHPSVLIKL